MMKETDTRQLLAQLVEENRLCCKEGKVADYIPELRKASPETLGITIHRISGEHYTAGDCNSLFTLQSISKVITLILAFMDRGPELVFRKVGMEPTGDVYNSMLKLELVTPGKPFNPMINAGAIAVTSMINGNSPEERFQRILAFVRELADDPSIDYSHAVYISESDTAHKNRSLAYLLKENKILEGEVEEHLQVYFKQCSIEVSCRHLARIGMILANGGVDPSTQKRLIPYRYVQITKTFMVTCGMYDASGEFAIRVGIPAKSGVSGGIMALVPNQMGIGIIGPALNEKGNSIAGVKLLERLSELWKLSMF
jgi:glutaminase